MEKNKIIILALVVVIVIIFVGIFLSMPHMSKTDTKLSFKSNSTIDEGDSIKIKLTDEWNKILAHIYWYKYFLEKCDEEKYKILSGNDKHFIDKTLPYIIALRLNSCFLDEFSVLHFEDMKVVTISK